MTKLWGKRSVNVVSVMGKKQAIPITTCNSAENSFQYFGVETGKGVTKILKRKINIDVFFVKRLSIIS